MTTRAILPSYSWRAREAQAMLERFVERMADGSTLETLTGAIYTERGIVTASSRRSDPPLNDTDRGTTLYRFMRHGRCYVVREDVARPKRSMIRMATRLIRGKVKLVAE